MMATVVTMAPRQRLLSRDESSTTERFSELHYRHRPVDTALSVFNLRPYEHYGNGAKVPQRYNCKITLRNRDQLTTTSRDTATQVLLT